MYSCVACFILEEGGGTREWEVERDYEVGEMWLQEVNDMSAAMN